MLPTIPDAIYLASDSVTILDRDDPNVAIVQRGNLRTFVPPKPPQILIAGKWIDAGTINLP